ncbi:MAG: hypothetical protein IJX88_03150 [Clostridia bacterium]|nr:hypothetical protein [Clostridia bacterium]
MKLEKREITLNEADSVKDVYQTEKFLLYEYVNALSKVQTKEARSAMMSLIKEVGEDMLFMKELIQRTEN